MKTGSLRPFELLVISGLLEIAVLSCAGSPPPSTPAPAPVPEENVFTLLNNGENARAKEFFKGRADVNDKDAEGRTALHIASLQKNAELMAFLLQRGAKIDAQDAKGRTAIEIAAEQSDAAGVKLLAEAGAALFINDGPANGTVRFLLKDASLLTAALTQANVNSKDANGRTLLHLAAMNADKEKVKIILERGARANELDTTGQTALDYALGNSSSIASVYAAESLVRAGGKTKLHQYDYCIPAIRTSNFDIRFDDGFSALHFAARDGHTGIIRYLIEKKANVNAKNASGAPPLHEAFRAGEIEAAKLLLDAGADVNARDAKGNTAMHLVMPLATRQSGLRLLLSRGADPNTKDDLGDSPLHVAVGTNMGLDIVRILVENGASVNIRNTDGKTPLHTAIERNRVEYIGPLIENSADIFAADLRGKTPFDAALDEGKNTLNAAITPRTVTSTDKEGNTILHLAILRKASVDNIAKILDNAASVNARNMNGDTPLHLAVGANQRDNGELLIARGADIFAINAEGKTPLQLAAYAPDGLRTWMLNSKTIEAGDGLGNGLLHYAALWKNDALIPILIQAGCKPDRQNATGETPIFAAIRADSPSTIAALISQGASSFIRDSSGNTALHAAVRWNAKHALKELVESGADIEAGNLHGKTALHEAVRLGMADSERMLLEAGARLESKDLAGNTPLLDAVQGGLSSAVERLLENGASVMVRNNEGNTPLHIAVAADKKEIVRILLFRGSSMHARNAKNESPLKIALRIGSEMAETVLTKDRINQPDDDGNTPLHIAFKEKAPAAIVTRMIEIGANLSDCDAQGLTPLHLALETKRFDLCKILVEAGADPFIATGSDENAAQLSLKMGAEAVVALFGEKALNKHDAVGNTVLHYAASNAPENVIRLLIDLGAEKNIKNVSGERPQDIARRWKREQIETLLRT